MTPSTSPAARATWCPLEIPAEIFDACMAMATTAHPGAGLPRCQPHRFPLGRGEEGMAGLILLETNTHRG